MLRYMLHVLCSMYMHVYEALFIFLGTCYLLIADEVLFKLRVLHLYEMLYLFPIKKKNNT